MSSWRCNFEFWIFRILLPGRKTLQHCRGLVSFQHPSLQRTEHVSESTAMRGCDRKPLSGSGAQYSSRGEMSVGHRNGFERDCSNAVHGSVRFWYIFVHCRPKFKSTIRALWAYVYTLCLKKVPTFKLSVTLSNLNRFSKLLYCWKAYEICYKTDTTLLISP